MSNRNQQPKSLRPNIPLPKGTEHHRCTDVDSWGGKPWCSIQVDINGEHVTSNPLLAATWGYCSDSCTRDCETDCNTCDLVKKDKCTECGNGKYLTPAGKCETGCPDGLITTGTLAAGRSCQQKYSRRFVAATYRISGPVHSPPSWPQTTRWPAFCSMPPRSPAPMAQLQV